ncbi:hypothetical protein [Acuticoccus sediminis]|uniref:hypothetical protein n=1 Tax=Acuticoccus sediminis TaxID=2184697 RepID=UPI0011B93880|nr:hypothetical protein [Acuticoccus sediminis]
MGLILALIAALALAPATSHSPVEAPITVALSRATAASSDVCTRIGEAPRGTLGYVFGTSDRQVAELPLGTAANCIAALWDPDAHRGAVRVLLQHAPSPDRALKLASELGLCDGAGDLCEVARCKAPSDPKRELDCLSLLKGPAAQRMSARYLAAVAKVRLDPETYSTLIAARQSFSRLVDAGYYPALGDLALMEYRLTNLEAAYDIAMRGAAYRLPAAEALAAYLKVEGFGVGWDLPGALDLARDASIAGTGDGEAVLAMDISYLFSPRHWTMLQKAMIRADLHPGPADGHFRESWSEALNTFTQDHHLPPGVTLGALDALGILKPVSDTVREQRAIRRY